MRRSLLALGFALVALPAAAATLRCVSVNGNVNCVGDGAQACQTVNGRTVCSSGDGSVVQSFGDHRSTPQDYTGGDDEDDEADVPAPPPRRTWRTPQREHSDPGRMPAPRNPKE